MPTLLHALLAALALTAATGSEAAQANPFCRADGIQQLRIYEIFDANKAAFHARFRDHALRIMKRYGFEVIRMWETRHGGRTELVYLLQWPNETVMKERWSAFLADEEWIRIKRETAAAHGQMVGDIEERALTKTDYSPC
jgi:hypothetical protein